MKTAVEFYREELNALVSFKESKFKTEQEIFEQAKEMEEEQMIEFACKVYEERMQTHGGDTLEIANKLVNL